MHMHNFFYIKTFKIAPICFDPKTIFREPHCSLLKSRFYLHLERAHQHNGMWQHTQISRLMDNLYQKLNKKLPALTNQTSTKHDNSKNASKFQ